MTVKVEIEFPTLTEALAFFERTRPLDKEPRPFEHVPAHLETVAVLAPAAEPVPEPEKPKKTRTKKVIIDVGKSLEDLAKETMPVLTLDNVRAALAGLLAAKGHEACGVILDKYKITRVSELAESLYPEFIAGCKA